METTGAKQIGQNHCQVSFASDNGYFIQNLAFKVTHFFDSIFTHEIIRLPIAVTLGYPLTKKSKRLNQMF